MLPLAARVGEAVVNVLNVVLLDHIEYLLRIGHGSGFPVLDNWIR
jgi:hypothetical protein